MHPFNAILEYFTYEHLPPHLQGISRPFCELAYALAEGDNSAKGGNVTTGHGPLSGPELTVALRKLLEAKDCAVRAALAHAPTETWQSRLRAEHLQLEGRLGKLSAFIGTADFEALDEVDRVLLLDQRNQMAGYHEVLRRRLDLAEQP